MGVDVHQPFGLELEQRLADGDAADAELGGQRILAELEAFGEFAVEDAAAQFLRRRFDAGAVAELEFLRRAFLHA